MNYPSNNYGLSSNMYVIIKFKLTTLISLELLFILINRESRKQAVMDQVRNELALANAQELINVREFLMLYRH